MKSPPCAQVGGRTAIAAASTRRRKRGIGKRCQCMLWRRVGLGPLGVWREFSHQKLLGGDCGDWKHGILFSIWLVVTGTWNFILHLNLVGGDWNHGILFSIKNWLVVTGTLEFYSPSKTVWWWLEPWNFMNSMIYGNVIIPTDEHILQRSRSTTNQKMWLKPWRNDDRWFQTAPGNEDSNMFKPQKKAKQV